MSIVRMYRLLAAAGLAALLLPVALDLNPAFAQSVAGAKNRLVVQVSDADPAKWNLALNNAKNVQTDLGNANVDIEIVAYGPGIGMLKSESVVGNRIGEALGTGVKVVACENTMHAQKLQKSDMLNGIGYVGAGVVEIMQKQQQGWAYLRP
jgi:intracellular sulfur oxidation DsrE/DsrF family protein